MMRPRFDVIALAAMLAAWSFIATTRDCQAQITSTWQGNAASGDWFNPLQWDNGIPNAAGDVARIPAGSNLTIQLSQPATVGQLIYSGVRQSTMLGSGALTFDRPGTDPALIQLAPPTGGGTINATVNRPISIALNEELSINVGLASTLTLGGAVSATSGNITKIGPGTLTLGNTSTSWAGQLLISSGRVSLLNSNGLGATSGYTVVNADGILSLFVTTAEPVELNNGVYESNSSTALVISSPIHLAANGTIRNAAVTVGSTWNGIIDGAGELTLGNTSTGALVIGGNSTYTGRTFISGTSFRATSAAAFGDASQGTTIQAGTLTLDVPVNEDFLVQTGGTLAVAAGATAYNRPVALNGGTLSLAALASPVTPVVVQSGGGTVQLSGSNSLWTGGSSGTGNLRLNGRVDVNAPLTHVGNLTLEHAKLNVANTYQGETIILNDSEINHPQAVSGSPVVRIQANALTLNAIPSNAPQLSLETGWLTVATTAQPLTSVIKLGGGPGDATIETAGMINGPIQLTPSSAFQRLFIAGGTINGGISGNGNVILSGSTANPLQLNSANDIGGSTEIAFGIVNANHPAALNDFATFVSRGRLNLNVPAKGNIITNQNLSGVGTLGFNVAQEYSEPWVVNSGSIEAAAQVGMSDLIVLEGTMRGVGSGAFRLDDDMRVIHSAAIEGGVRGDADIRLLGYQLLVSQDFNNFTGDFHVHTGVLNFGYLGSGFTVATTLNPETDIHVYDGSTLKLSNGTSSGDVIIENDIFLHNARGYIGEGGALVRYGNGSNTLRGRVNVGDEGSTIVGSFRMEGLLTGSNLTINGGGFEIVNSQNELHGDLRLTHQAALNLGSQGQVHGIDRLLLEGGSTLSFGPGTAANRLDDSTEIVSRGGFISLVSSNNAATGEVLGNLKLETGNTRIVVSSDHGSQAAALTINQITREQGSILRFRQAGFANTTRILSGASLTHGIIGPWAITEDGFATLSPTGIVTTLSATQFNDLNTAGPDDHVRISGNHLLNADKSIASLQHNPNGNPASLDLGGHRLTIRSGGVFRNQDIKNGSLTAGESSAAELIFHDSANVSANIVDNAGGGAVSVIASSNAMQLSGNNSYTGGTWVIGSEYYPSTNATLSIGKLSAIPANDRVYVDHGVYELQPLTSGEVALAELHLRNGGYVSGSFLAPLNVKQMYLEDGSINALFAGNGSIIKTTDGAVSLSNSTGSAFTGTVTVRDGVLSIGNGVLPQAKFIVEGGRLDISGGGFAPNVVLKGGTLGDGLFNGNIDVQADSELFHSGRTRYYGAFSGSGDLTIRGQQNNAFDDYVGMFGNANAYSGDIRIESGALRVGTSGNAGSGIITVEAAGRLILGRNDYLDPPTSINNVIHVNGGTIYSTPPWNTSIPGIASPSTLTGNVFVHEGAFIGALRNGVQGGKYVPGLTFAGQLTLTDGSHVYGRSDGRSTVATGDVALVDISGELRVGEDVTWHLLTSSLSISGVIRPESVNSSINFVGIRSLLRMGGAGIQVDAGKSLAIQINGEALPVEVSGAGNIIAGSGLLEGTYTVTNGAAISPGSSPGLLSINGQTTIATNGHLSIELGGAALGTQYDSLDVSGNVFLSGALLDVSFLNGFTPTNNDAFVILRGSSITGKFANAQSSIVVGGMMLPVTYFEQMVVLGNAAAIPEPATAVLIALAAGGIGSIRRRSAHSALR
jgi:autotransporter-associated beta strand protein